MSHQPVRSPLALEALDRLRPVAMALPEVVEATDGFGHISFRVRNKPFVIVGHGHAGEGSLSIKSDIETQQFLVDHLGFERTPFIGQHGWVSLPGLPPESWEEIERLIADGYRLAAPASLARRVPDEEDE
jgi:predicted DNA-binding protein (MmcQ/YjbR family)